jgi:hypothetical protein
MYACKETGHEAMVELTVWQIGRIATIGDSNASTAVTSLPGLRLRCCPPLLPCWVEAGGVSPVLLSTNRGTVGE